MNRKKTANLFLLLLLLSGITLCLWIFWQRFGNLGRREEGNYETYNKHFVMITGSEDSDLWDRVYESALEEGKARGVYVERFGENLATEYGRDERLKLAIQACVDGIIVPGDEKPETVALINEAIKKKIPVVTVLRDSTGSFRQCFVGNSNYNLGQEYGRQITELLKEKQEGELTEAKAPAAWEDQVLEGRDGAAREGQIQAGKDETIRKEQASAGKDEAIRKEQASAGGSEAVRKDLLPEETDGADIRRERAAGNRDVKQEVRQDPAQPARVLVLIDESRGDTSQNLILLGIRETLEKEFGKPAEGTSVSVETRAVNNTRSFSSEESIRDIFLDSEDLPDILVCLSAVHTRCAYQAAVDYNKVGSLQILGYYDSDTILDAVAKNIIHSTVALDTDQMGRRCVEALDEYVETGYTNSYQAVDARLITSEEAKKLLEDEE